MRPFTVIKRDAQGNDELSYTGTLVERSDACVCIDAVFASPDRDLGYIHLRRGDRFREWFFENRWFNIFRIQDAASRALKGWYCNITRPPVIEAGQVAAEDLGLDVFVYPDGRTLLLDEADFAQLRLPAREVTEARAAVDTIIEMVESRAPPFDEIRTKESRPRPAP